MAVRQHARKYQAHASPSPGGCNRAYEASREIPSSALPTAVSPDLDRALNQQVPEPVDLGQQYVSLVQPM